MSLRDFVPLLGLLVFGAAAGAIGARFRGAVGGTLFGAVTGMVWAGYLMVQTLSRIKSFNSLSVVVGGSPLIVGAVIGSLTGGYTAWMVKRRRRRN